MPVARDVWRWRFAGKTEKCVNRKGKGGMTIRKKLAVASVLSVMLLAACSNNTAQDVVDGEQANDLLARIQENGEIVIAMEGTSAPWTYHDEEGRLAGYDVEVGRLIGEQLGVGANFIEGEWDGLLAGLDARRYDIMVNGVDITEERAEKYDFRAICL